MDSSSNPRGGWVLDKLSRVTGQIREWVHIADTTDVTRDWIRGHTAKPIPPQRQPERSRRPDFNVRERSGWSQPRRCDTRSTGPHPGSLELFNGFALGRGVINLAERDAERHRYGEIHCVRQTTATCSLLLTTPIVMTWRSWVP